MIQNQEFIQEFVEEAKSHIEKVEAVLLNREGLADPELINDIFRAVHSIKGTAGFFGLKNIVSLAHAMENVFGEIRSGRMVLSGEMEETLLTANDCIKDMVENILSSEERDISQLVSRVNEYLQPPKALGTTPAIKDQMVVMDDQKQCKTRFTGVTCELLKESIKHGHKLYEIKLRIIHDLLEYTEGPVKFFGKLETIGVVIDTYMDHSEINSLDDVLDALENKQKDVWIGILITSILEKELLAEGIDISEESIKILQVELANICPPGQDEQIEDAAVESKVINNPKDSEENHLLETVPKKEVPSKQLKIDDSIRVHVSILNDLLDMAGEMVLGRNQLLRTLENYRKTIPGLAPILQNIDRLTTGVQEKVMMTRMQPVANVFSKFPRIIRDISKNLAKDIDLELEGQDVELDKSMIEALTDPLTHLVRNAADHGIETGEQREKSGKPRGGKIILRAYHEGGYVNIDIIDDGKGIDIEKVKQKALEKEVITVNELDKLNEQEVLKLIFKPGLSTAEKVSDLSGRGVGMDVVKTNIEKLGGSIEVYTTPGIGTTIRLMLPLTLAIIQSLIVEVEGHRFSLPQVNLKEIVRIKKGDTANRIEYLHEAEVLRLRGRLLPIIHLADALGLQRTFIDAETGEKKPDRRQFFGDQRAYDPKTATAEAPETVASRRDNHGVIRVLVLKIGNRMFGMVVDSIIGREETLVKPLPIYLKDCICYSGVTILGDGKTSMILDSEGIIRLTDLKFREETDTLSEVSATSENDFAENQNLLLFKCSGNETYAMDLAVVSRIEEIQSTAIEKVGDKEYIKFNGSSLRVIRLEDYLPVNRQDKEIAKYYVIIPKLVSHPIGILIEKVLDNVSARINLNTEDIVTEGLIGSAIFENKILLLINIYEIFEKADPQHYQSTGTQANGEKRILLVEDTQFFQRIEQKYLESAGYRVTLAKNGREALDILTAGEFEIIVSDINMPVMDGLEFIQKVRDNPKSKHLPAIALTSMSDEMTKQTILENGFDYYEWKLDRDSLLKTIEKAITSIAFSK